MNKMIELEGVNVIRNKNLILDNISLTINDTDFLGLLGPSGSGKTTLLKIMSGLIIPDTGKVTYYTSKKPKIGYLPQTLPSLPNSPATVMEIISSGFNSKPFTNNNEKVISMAKEMAIDHLLDLKITQLSGGQIQLIFLIRALIDSPDIIILDEPSSSIDTKSQSKIFQILTNVNKNLIPVVFSSHDTFAITNSANRIACINKKLDYHGSSKDFLSNKHLTEAYGYDVDVLSHQGHD
jgi:ABC-type Mn2+/Zn2+ transport system ATPase subunit